MVSKEVKVVVVNHGFWGREAEKPMTVLTATCQSPQYGRERACEYLYCVESQPKADQVVLSPPLPKAVIKATLGSLPAFLKDASLRH